MAFLLRLLNHNEPINQSLISHQQPFTILTGGKRPAVRASVGPFSSLQRVPSLQETWQSEHSFATNEYPSSLGAFILEENIFSQHPELRVLFHVTTGEASPIEASCVFLMANHGTEFVRTSCRPSGHTAACLAQLTLPQYWFEHSGLAAADRGGQPSEVEVYYLAQEGVERVDKVSHGLEDCAHSLQNLPRSTGHDSWTSLGRALLLRGRAPEPFIIVKLGHGLVAQIPYNPSNAQEVFMISIITSPNSSIDQFTLSVRGHHGVSILEVVPGGPSRWDIRSQVSNKESFSTAVTQASRTLSLHGNGQGKAETVILLTVKVQNDTSPRQGRLLWQVYRPGQIAEENTDTVITEMPPSLEGPQFIRAFPAATELMNTAVLTGQLVLVPLRVLAVGAHHLILDVSEKAKCYSPDEGILKVSGGCEAVFVDGSERSGALRARIHVAYEQLTTSLELNVWFPHLPLLLELSDSQLNPIKGWRVPILAHKRQMHGSENEEEIVEDEEEVEVDGQDYEDDEVEKENRSSRGRGCTLQLQHTWVRVWAQFVADDDGQPAPLLSPDWALDVSDLVRGRLTVEDPKVVELRDGHILVGRASGTTAVQVLSPLSDSILGERAVTVRKERVSVSALRVQLISGLSTTVRKSAIDPAVFVATTTAGSVLRAPKQVCRE
uniref:transmembrane protein 132C-like isoform X2 n=1 Tax=Myxine glutinosa TaxID=7769 RepID=UPI00358FBE38